MALPIFLNNVSSTVQAGSSAIGSASATGVNVAGGDGAKWGAVLFGQYIPAAIVDPSTTPETIKEYVWVTTRVTDAFTVTRGAESTSAYPASTTSIQAGYKIVAMATATPLSTPIDFLPTGMIASGGYDNPLNVYTPNNTVERKFAAKLAQVAAGSGEFKLAAVGPSTLTYNGTSIIRGAQDWPTLLKAIFEANGYLTGEGALRTNDYLGPDLRWGFTGTWATLASAGAAVEYGYTVISGASATLRSTRPGTKVELEVSSDSGAFTITVDGVNPTTLTNLGVAATIAVTNGSAAANVITPSGSNLVTKVTVAGLPLGNHQFKLSANSTTAVKLFGVDFFPALSVRLANFGASGTKTGHWADTSAFNTQLNLVLAWAPDCCIFDMAAAVNDYNQVGGTPNATIQANLITSITALQTASVECILIAPLPFQGLNSNPTPAAGDPFWQIFYNVADITGCAMIDLFDRWGADYTKPAANGLIGADNFHPNAAGYADVAQAIAAFMRLNSQQAPISVYNGVQSPFLKRWGALAETFPRALSTANTIAMSGTGIPRAVAIGLNKGDVVAGITFKTGTTAGATMTHHWAALLYEDGQVLAVSADKTSAAIAASSEIVYAMAAPWTIVISGLYYLVWCVTATTMPTMEGVSSLATAMTGPPILAATAASQTTPPAAGAVLTLTAAAGSQFGYVS